MKTFPIMRNPNPLHNLLNRLESVREVRGGWKSRCPAHDDPDPSLSVSLGIDGRVLLHCFGGCDTASVLHVIGLKFRDLFAL